MVWTLKTPLRYGEAILRRTVERCPIGVDAGDYSLKLAQLETTREVTTLVAADIAHCPQNLEAGSAAWQRWAIEAIRDLTSSGKYRGKGVVATLPACEAFVENIKLSQTDLDGLQKSNPETISKVKQELPFDCDDMIIKAVPAEQGNVVVVAAKREIIDRHLAIYEKADLQIKSLAIWPAAMANTYTRFFGRRGSDVQSVVMLICIEADRTSVVICRHKVLLFARSLAMGTKQLGTDEAMTRLVLELSACGRHFKAMYRDSEIERLIFLLGSSDSREICLAIAKQLEIPAQIGDCLAAVKIPDAGGTGIDRRQLQPNWSVAFGLSLL